MTDPITNNPQFYRVMFENDRVRVLEYLDGPGDATLPHRHPDSVMVTLSAFTRRLRSKDHEVDVEMPAFQARWLDAQEHSGENTGITPTHAIFVELKEPHGMGDGSPARLGPSES
ncbi:MAG: hypothetical protein Q4P15_04490 [Propionibacteriaceae bacterium]|nr:hypothetical protein [Propionibacteriaceae bacterium]